MKNKYFTYLLGLIGILWVTGSCVEPITGPDPLFGRDGIVLHFGLQSAYTLDISTKGTQGLDAEGKVENLYLFFFSPQNELLYKEFFDGTTLNKRWSINSQKTTEAPWDGTVHLNDDLVASTDNMTVVGFSNIDSDIKTSLDDASTMAALEELSAAIGEGSVDHLGSMMMSGIQSGVTEDAGHFFVNGSTEEMMLPLRRLYAKVRFRVAINPEKIKSFNLVNWQVYRLPKTAYLLEHGSYEDRGNRNRLVDKGGNVADNYYDMPGTSHQFDMLNDQFNPEDKTQLLRREFSFYMLENRKNPKNPFPDGSYKYRDQKFKTTEGLNEPVFKYADDNATYVVIKAQIWMRRQDPTISANVEYLVHLGDFSENTGSSDSFDTFRNHAYIYTLTINDVGDIRYEVEHNTFDPNDPYGSEKEAGATGMVVVADEAVFDADAHYNSQVITFHAKNISEDNITWYVETPFNPQGAYPNLDAAGNTEVYSGDNEAWRGKPRPQGGDDNSWGTLDYEWVEFRVNVLNPDGKYSENRRLYKPRNYNWNKALSSDMPDYESDVDAEGHISEVNRTMDVIGLVNFLKQQKIKYKKAEPNAFDSEGKITVTAFVNEFYYERHPFTGAYDKDLWKQVVNIQSPPMRYMHILSKVVYSADKESSELGSTCTIQQHPIQSIYNISNPELRSAWGSEWYDDESTHFSNRGTYSPETKGERGNNEQANGRLNSLREWRTLKTSPRAQNQSLEGSFTNNGEGSVRWDEYLDLTAKNESPLLWDGTDGQHGNYRYLRWSCMTRNRDNNGNGLIDRDEIRWYMGATHQLIGLFLGSRGVVGAAQLYQRTTAQQMSSVTTEWRQHLVSSSLYVSPKDKPKDSDGQPRVIWAEEGMSGSNPTNSTQFADGMKEFSTRCVRNLGAYQTSASVESSWQDITFALPETEPQPYIDVIRLKDGDASHTPYSGSYKTDVYYVFDCSRMNEASIRAFWDSGDVNGETNRDLILHNENEGAAFLSRRFTVASVNRTERNEYKTTNGTTSIRTLEIDGHFVNYDCRYIKGMNDYITDSGSNPFCPPGYRLPNVRELGVLWNFIPDGSFQRNCYFSRTYWTFGQEANAKDKSGNYIHPDALVNGVWLGEGKPNGTTGVRWGWGASTIKVLMADPKKNDQGTDWVRCVRDLHDGEY